MAFVYKADRPCLSVTKIDNQTGPGQYNPDEKPPVEENYVGFLTKEKRKTYSKIGGIENPGPGTYNLPVSVQGYNAQAKVFYSSVNPLVPSGDEVNPSSQFKSGSERFPGINQNEAPGPGAYQHENAGSLGKKKNGSNKTGFATKRPFKDHPNAFVKTAVPSIPSVVHAYGYTEVANREVILNNNPLLEIQKFVGPGYYDVPASNDYSKSKGALWGKSLSQRTNFALGIGSGAEVGPGAYKVKNKTFFSLYKLKPSAAFSSGLNRNGSNAAAIAKAKRAKKKANSNLMEEAGRPDDEDENTTPGPGYYYNSSLGSSIAKGFKPPSLQCFGSGNERFEGNFSSSAHVGPGRYNIPRDMGKKFAKSQEVNIPFLAGEKRFNERNEEVPGPGNYDVANKVYHQTKKVPGNYVESFGSTEARFKPSQEDILGPGKYHNLIENGDSENTLGTSVFSSKTKRETMKSHTLTPGPGAYNMSQSDVSTRLKKPDEDEDSELTIKKPPFNSAVDRFWAPNTKIEEQEDDDASVDEDWDIDAPTRGDLILKAKKQPKGTVAFTSKAKRVGFPLNANEKKQVPGPGKYYGKGQDDWIKKTYNVNFTAD